MKSNYTQEAVALLQRLIATPSISRDEKAVADIMEETLRGYGFAPRRHGNNVWAASPLFDENRPTFLLNAHLDTVKPAASWTRDPFMPTIEDGRLYGLGSNDCGGGLVSLLQAFRVLSEMNIDPSTHELRPSTYNYVFLASCEEEVGGADGIASVLPELPDIDVAIVGEPTCMQPAIAEKGLMVLDITWHGKSGHAARQEGVNAIYEAMADLEWIRSYKFRHVSPLLGETLMQVTQISAGTQHNVVPDEVPCCR